MKELFQHAAITEGITVRVAVSFLPDQSQIEAGKWFWVYHIRIENGSDEAVQLLTRHWRITDGRGMVNFIEGEGVVGEQPLLLPGQSHDTSRAARWAPRMAAWRGITLFCGPMTRCLKWRYRSSRWPRPPQRGKRAEP